MLDLWKLGGIIDAIEAESLQPHPSHANLARLIGMFCRELISSYEQKPEVIIPVSNETSNSTLIDDPNVFSEKPKKRLKKQG